MIKKREPTILDPFLNENPIAAAPMNMNKPETSFRQGAVAAPDESSPSERDRWWQFLVHHMFQLMHVYEKDNFDAHRYRGIPENAYFADQHATYFSMLLANLSEFFQARQLLADPTSRDLFDQLILFRILGHLHVRLPFDAPNYRRQLEIAESWRFDNTDDTGVLGPLAIFLVPGAIDDIRVKCWRENVAGNWLQRQYYFDRDGASVMPHPGEHLIDAGGCFGDTALAFADAVGGSGHIYTFDPIPKHCEVIAQNLAMNSPLAPRISVFQMGLSATVRAGDKSFRAAATINPGATIADDAIPTTTLDSLVQSGTIPRIDFIKMDIEGSELAALKGAEQVLREQRPRLAISLYHRPEDFFAIPLWIDRLGCGYRFHLEHYSMHHEETVLYATA